MTTVNAIDKQITSLELSFQKISEKIEVDDSNTLSNQEFKAINSEVLNCTASLAIIESSVAKILAKIDYKDPVSGALRYGDAARVKILGFNERIDTIKSKCMIFQTILSGIIPNNSTDLNESEQSTTNITINKAPVAGPLRSIDEYVSFKNNVDSIDKQTTELEDPELVEKAKLVRERKAMEALEVSRMKQIVEQELKDFVSYFNQIYTFYAQQSIPGNTTTKLLAAPLNTFLTSNDQVSKAVLLEGLKVVLSIVERILSRPDDINARRLRINHPLLQEKVTNLVGGIELLCAIGFQARLHSIESTSTTEQKTITTTYLLSSEIKTVLETLKTKTVSIENTIKPTKRKYGVDIFPLIAPGLLYEIHLEMTEPSIESLTSTVECRNLYTTTDSSSVAGTTTATPAATTTTNIPVDVDIQQSENSSLETVKLCWIDWFDGLTAMKASLEETISGCA